MNLIQYERLQGNIKDLISLFTVFAGIIGAFYNQKMIDTTLEKERELIPKQYWKIRLWYLMKMHTREWWAFIVCSILILSLNKVQNLIDGRIETEKKITQERIDSAVNDRQVKRDKEIQSTYFEQIRILRNDAKREQVELKEQNDSSLKDITGNMTKEWATYNNSNEKEHKITQAKVDSNKTIPAHISLIREPHNVFKLRIKNDSVSCALSYENSGQLTAYDATLNFYLLFNIGNTFYKMEMGVPRVKTGSIIGGTRSEFPIIYPLSKEYKLDRTSAFYGVIKGRFYSEVNKKGKKNIDLICGYWLAKESTIEFPLQISTDSLLKIAIPVDNIGNGDFD